MNDNGHEDEVALLKKVIDVLPSDPALRITILSCALDMVGRQAGLSADEMIAGITDALLETDRQFPDHMRPA